MTRALAVLAMIVLAAAVAGCAGSGTVIADGASCRAWLHGNGRDDYLRAHGLDGLDAGQRPATTGVARAMTDICTREPDLMVDVALRRAASPRAPAPARK